MSVQHHQNPPSFHGISLHVSVTIGPNIDKFLAAFKECFDKVTAEPECTFFEVYQDPDQPGRFKWVENWSRDKEWFMTVGDAAVKKQISCYTCLLVRLFLIHTLA